MEITSLFLGIGIGAFAMWLIAKFRFQSVLNGDGYLLKEKVKEEYVIKEVYEALMQRFKEIEQEAANLQGDYLLVSKALASKEQYAENLMEKLKTQKTELDEMQLKFRAEFENFATRLLEQKTAVFSRQSETNLTNILNPLKEKIKEFEEKVENTYWKEAKERISLKEEIKHLRDLNLQLSVDANQLVNALRGDNKFQGDWGEFRLEVLLEKAGLQQNIHYTTQASYKDEAGRQKRPDFIINLPENKHLVIDAKVSLKAYEGYFNTEDEIEKEKYLQQHLLSIRQHVKGLGSKNYQQLYQIQTPDYVLMFVPIEAAFSTALQADKQLFLDALDKNVVIVTTSTLLATMRTVTYIWKQEKQKRNVLEIARQSGLLYDKFCGFMEDLKDVGKKLTDAQTAYGGAMNKLNDSKKYGDTLIGRAQRIKQLGANASKSLPEELLE